jgi:Arc/MetJ-type ribon-helix-helix transcriptional regulator
VAAHASPLADREPEEPELAAKISISLYAEDLAHVDALIAYMVQSRRRINRSEAIKLALRAVKLTPELSALHEAIQRDDGRRKKSSKGTS